VVLQHRPAICGEAVFSEERIVDAQSTSYLV